MPEMRHELAVGESIVIDDYLLTVEDIRGEEVLFRIEQIPAGQSPSDGRLSSGAAWEPETDLTADNPLAGGDLLDVHHDETDPATRRSSPRSRPR